jgi:hypothetical protein
MVAVCFGKLYAIGVLVEVALCDIVCLQVIEGSRVFTYGSHRWQLPN